MEYEKFMQNICENAIDHTIKKYFTTKYINIFLVFKVQAFYLGCAKKKVNNP